MQDIIFDQSVKYSMDLDSHILAGVQKVENMCNGSAHTVVHLSREEDGMYMAKISVRAFHRTFFVEATAKDYMSAFTLSKRRLIKVLTKHKQKFKTARHPSLPFGAPSQLKEGA